MLGSDEEAIPLCKWHKGLCFADDAAGLSQVPNIGVVDPGSARSMARSRPVQIQLESPLSIVQYFRGDRTPTAPRLERSD